MRARAKLLICCLAFLTPVVLGEAWLRHIDRRKASRMTAGPQPVRASADPRVRYENRPGAVQMHRYYGPDGGLVREIRITINAQGFRGEEVELVKPPRTVRIVAIGDSQTYGSGVQEEEAWPAVLEREVAGQVGLQRVEVMNCAVGGYDIEQEVAALERWVEYEPDLVLLGFFVNDAAVDQVGQRPGGELAGAGAREIAGAPQVGAGAVQGHEVRLSGLLRFLARGRPGFLGWLRKRSQLVDFVCDVSYSKLIVREWARGGEALFRDDHPGWARTRAALERASGLAAARGSRFAVVLLPFLVRRQGRLITDGPYAKVARFCGERGIPCIDLGPAFEGMDVERLRVHQRDWHSGPEGHRIEGQAMARWIVADGLLAAKTGAK